MARAARTFRIFVSSTFSDLKEERNALQDRVFPRLQAFCLERGARFQAIDLRWGVSAEAGLDQQTINICLDEVKRCQETSPRPNFIILLGDRYGWQPPPPQIPKHEFDDILRRVSDPQAKARLAEWYPLDENAVPPEHYLKPREGEYRDDDTWGLVEAHLRTALEDAVRDMPIELTDRRKYETSATEQEIQRGALRSLEDHVFCYFRSIDFGSGDELPDHELLKDFVDLAESGERDETAKSRLERLKGELRKLPEENVHDYEARWTGESPVPLTTDHIDRLCEDVAEDLFRIISEEIELIEQVDPLEKEIAAHTEFGEDRARFFTGRTEILERVATYVDRPEGRPLVVWGASGSGKSAVMARAAQQAREDHPDSVVLRFIGVTPESSNGRALLAGLCREISNRYGGDESSIPSDYRELVRDFPERLALASGDRPLIVFLDALDQLSEAEGARSLSWLPSDLPAGVGLIVSTLPEGTLAPLRARLPDPSFAQLEPMRPGEGSALLDLWLEDAGRTLKEPQRTEVLGKFEIERLPLWLRLAFQEARLWRSDDGFPRIELPATTPEIIRDQLFDRLDDPENHGEVMISHSLAYLAAAKNGLSEDEMIEALSLGGREGTVLKDFFRRSPKSPKVDQLPVVVWSRLFFDLEPYLTERAADGASLMTFYHRQLAEAVTEIYLVGDEGLARHRELARYFDGKPLQIEGEQDTTPNLRKMSELPYQQTMGELWDDVFATLTDFEFLERKAADMPPIVESTDAQGNVTKTYTGIYQIRDDYALALERMPGGGGGGGGKGGRRRIIVTGVDFGNGLVVRCPHCNALHPFKEEWKGKEIDCPNETCKGPLRVNPFVVQRQR